MLLAKIIASFRLSSNAKDSSFRQYTITHDKFAEFLGRKPAVSDLKDDTISEFVRWMKERASAATANTKRQHMLTFAKKAFKRGTLLRPVDSDEIFRATEMKRVPDSWHPEEVGQILKSCEAEPMDQGFGPLHWKLAIYLLYDTGCRKNALLKAMRSDVSEGKLRLIPENQKRGNEQFFDLSAESLALIEELPESPDGRLLPWPYTVETLGRRYEAILERAGLPSGRRDKLQKLRRTSITQTAIAHGVEKAQIRAGHTNQKMTWAHYLDTSKFKAEIASGIARPM